MACLYSYFRELILWDTEALTKVQSIAVDPSRTAVDMDLCGVSPIVITSDNVFQFSPGARNGPMNEKGRLLAFIT